MRHILLFITITTLFACTQNDTKQKELALKEKELALKEKELNLREKDSANMITKVDTGNTKLNQAPPSEPLVVTPLNISGDIGQITFSQKGKTVFYFDAKTKRGKIVLNGKEYILNKIVGDYVLSGNNVSISTTHGEWAEMESDCGYGKSLIATIKMGTQVLTIKNVEVQDCSSMIE